MQLSRAVCALCRSRLQQLLEHGPAAEQPERPGQGLGDGGASRGEAAEDGPSGPDGARAAQAPAENGAAADARADAAELRLACTLPPRPPDPPRHSLIRLKPMHSASKSLSQPGEPPQAGVLCLRQHLAWLPECVGA